MIKQKVEMLFPSILFYDGVGGDNMTKINNMYSTYEPLECRYCGIDTLENPGNSIVAIKEINNLVEDVFVCCKGECDHALGSVSGWKDLEDFVNPYLYLKHIMSVFNSIHEDNLEFTNEALEGYKQVLIRSAPYVFRNMSAKEIDKAITSNILPF